ncbi:MAG: YebC/PmpR family DNA-binding transcriptional regulator [Patescibacteria group bacterium]
MTNKGTNDAKRGAVFTKLANAITIAVKSHNNPSTLIEKAQAANMPKDKIQRAIDRATPPFGGGDLSEAIFEGFGPQNVAIIIETITDNTTRTSQEIKNIFSKNGGVLGKTDYLFTRFGEIEVEGVNIFEKALDAGAEDVSDSVVYTKPEDLHKVTELLAKDLKIISSELVFKPNKETMINADIADFLEMIDNLDDVQNIYCNAVPI